MLDRDGLYRPARQPRWSRVHTIAILAAMLSAGLAIGGARLAHFQMADWGSNFGIAAPFSLIAFLAVVLVWPREKAAAPANLRASIDAEARLSELGLAYQPAYDSPTGSSRLLWAHNWQPFESDDPSNFTDHATD